MQKAGIITDLRFQVPYDLIPKQGNLRGVKYIADFVYVRDGKVIVSDAKGIRTREYIIKKKLMKFIHNIDIEEI